jgi:hypothetical protein
MRRGAAANPGGPAAPAWLTRRCAGGGVYFDSGTPCRERRLPQWTAGGLRQVASDLHGDGSDGTGPNRWRSQAMPTDVAAVMRRRAFERRQESATVLVVPVLMCIVTVAMALASPTFAATFRQFGLF